MAARNAIAFLLLAGAAAAAWANFGPGAGDTSGEGVDNPDTDDGSVPSDDPLADLQDTMTATLIGGMTLSDSGLQAIMTFEGFSSTPYPDFKGSSIGYGHLIKPTENFASVTQAQAAQLLAQDVQWAVKCVNAAVNVTLTQGQFDALVSFAFNVGAGAFRSSTLLRLLNAGDVQGASDQFRRWNMAGGQVNQALVERRADEQATFDS